MIDERAQEWGRLEREAHSRSSFWRRNTVAKKKGSPSLLLLVEPIKIPTTVPATAQFDRSSIRAFRHHTPPASMLWNRPINRAIPATEHLHLAQVAGPTQTPHPQRL